MSTVSRPTDVVLYSTLYHRELIMLVLKCLIAVMYIRVLYLDCFNVTGSFRHARETWEQWHSPLSMYRFYSTGDMGCKCCKALSTV